MRLTTTLLGVALATTAAYARLDEFYCGDSTCYEILGVSKMAKPKEIMRAYRAISKDLHPDSRGRLIDDKKKAYDEALAAANGNVEAVDIVVPTLEELESEYVMVNKAYETLSRVEKRKEYDTLLNDPFRYKVMKRKYYGGGENIYINPIFPVILLLVVGTVGQNYLRKEHVKLQRNQAVMSLIFSESFAETIEKRASSTGKRSELKRLQLDESKQKEFADFARELCKDDIAKVKFQGLDSEKIETMDLFAVRVIMLPYTIPMFFYNAASDYYRFNVLKEEPTAEQMRYMTAKAFNMTPVQFDAATDKNGVIGVPGLRYIGNADELIARKLWKKSNMKKYEEDLKAAELAKYPRSQRKRIMREAAKEEAKKKK